MNACFYLDHVIIFNTRTPKVRYQHSRIGSGYVSSEFILVWPVEIGDTILKIRIEKYPSWDYKHFYASYNICMRFLKYSLTDFLMTKMSLQYPKNCVAQTQKISKQAITKKSTNWRNRRWNDINSFIKGYNIVLLSWTT